VTQLTSQGYPAYLQQAVVGNREVFRVRVGPFDTESVARGMATELKAAGYPGAWLVR
jgi:cell division septation protein DedD